MKRAILPLATLVFSSGFVVDTALSATSPAVSPAVQVPLETSLEALRRKAGFPALAVATFKGTAKSVKKTVVAVGFRKDHDPTPVAKDDPFHFGSCGKSMTATLAALLVEEGLLKWESTLGELLPDVKGIHPEFAAVPFELLLAHSAGVVEDLMSFQGGVLWKSLWDRKLDPVRGRRMVVEGVLSVKPTSKPGTQFGYSNASYIVAGHILERLAGMPYETLLRKRLFEPLGMASCGFGAAGTAKAKTPDAPWGHVSTATGLTPVPPGFKADNPPAMRPAGGMHCSVGDWLKYVKLHLAGHNHARTPLLSHESFGKLHKPFRGGDYTFGGWNFDKDSEGRARFSHNGSNTLNYSLVGFTPEAQTAAVAVTNSAPEGAEAHLYEAIEQVLSHRP